MNRAALPPNAAGRRRRSAAASAATLAFAAVLLGVLAAGSAPAANGHLGRAAYFRYCSSCHGDDGTGNGPVAASLRTTPTDLRTLAKRNGGVFPYAEVIAAIDGRTRVDAHGSSAMPVWGKVLSEAPTPAYGNDAETEIRLITSYLSSIQTN